MEEKWKVNMVGTAFSPSDGGHGDRGGSEADSAIVGMGINYPARDSMIKMGPAIRSVVGNR
jgi:hypothetical protein